MELEGLEPWQLRSELEPEVAAIQCLDLDERGALGEERQEDSAHQIVQEEPLTPLLRIVAVRDERLHELSDMQLRQLDVCLAEDALHVDRQVLGATLEHVIHTCQIWSWHAARSLVRRTKTNQRISLYEGPL